MTTNKLIVAGTGHRPDKLGGYSDNVRYVLVELAKNLLATYDDIDTVISVKALGWDQALAEAAIYHNIKLIAAIPFKGQELAWPRIGNTTLSKLT